MLLGARLQHVRARQVAPDADRAVQRRRPLRSLAARAAASSASTASWAATRNQYYPDLVYDNHQVEPPQTPEEGYHLTEDLADHAIEFIADAKQVAPDKPFFMYFCTGRDARAPPRRRRSGSTSTRASSTTAGTPTARRCSSSQLEAGHRAAGHAAVARAIPDVAAWDTPGRRREAPLRAHDGGVRRLPRAHRPPHRAAASTSSRRSGSSTTRSIMVVSDNGASAEGGPHGSVNENLFFNNVPETLEDEPRRRSTSWAGRKYFNHYPWGWAWAGNTPFRRWKRETYRGGVSRSVHRALAEGHQGARARSATQYAHVIDMVPTVLDALGIEPPDAIRGVTQSPIEGVSFAHAFDDAKAPTPPPHAVLRDVRPPRHLSRRLARGLPGARAVVRRGGHGLRRDGDHRGEAARARRRTAGSSTTSTRTSRRRKNLADAAPRQADRDDRALVRRGRQVQRAADRQPRHRAPRRGAAAARAARASATSTTRARRRSRTRSRRASSTGRTASPRRSRSRTAPRACCVAQGGSSGGYALYVKDHKLHYAYNYLGVQQFHVATDATIADGRARAALRVRADRQARPRARQGHARRARSSTSTASWPAQGDLPVTIPLDIGITEGLTCGRDEGSAVTDRLRGAVRVHRQAGEGRRRRVGRADRGQERRDALGHGAPVARRPPARLVKLRRGRDSNPRYSFWAV